MAMNSKWSQGTSSRGHHYMYCNGEHVNLTELKEDHPNHRYLRKENIPNYPKCLFSVSEVCHVTDVNGLHGIFEDEGFQGGDYDNFLWWDLSVTADDCIGAEITFHNSTEFSWQSPNQMPFLKKFTTSPAFQSSSRYGNFRFTLTLRELLNIYSKEFCDSTAPILRVMDTRLYKQEIQYSVLVHPRYMTHYRKYPRLPVNITNDLCEYSQRQMSWRCQSPSDRYKNSLEMNNEEGDVYCRRLRWPEYYVWDHVAVAFHMKQDWVLPVDHSQLFDCLSVCEMASGEPDMSIDEAEAEVEYLRYLYI